MSVILMVSIAIDRSSSVSHESSPRWGFRPISTTSSALAPAGSSGAWGTAATSRARLLADNFEISLPPTRTDPRCGDMTPAISFINVDFPTPFGPPIPTILPSPISRSTPDSTLRFP